LVFVDVRVLSAKKALDVGQRIFGNPFMKILHVLDHSIPLHSGYTFRTRAILEQQHAMGWETIHVTSAKQTGGKYGCDEVNGLQFFRSKNPDDWLAKVPVINQVAIVQSLEERLEEVIKETQPQLIHAHSPGLNGLAALKAARRNSLPLVYECRAFWEDAAVDHGTSHQGGLRYRATKGIESYVFREADAVTTICEGLRQDIVQRGIPEEKVTVIPNAVDINRFEFGCQPDKQLREKLGLTGKTVLGYIGSFYAYEGLTTLLQAMPDIVANHPEVCLLLVGGGPQEDEVRKSAEQLGILNHVIFQGRVPHEEVKNYYDQVDIFVYPRLSMRLTELVTPLKPLEAMAQGRLVVASDVGGHKELIRDGENGWLFKAGDPSAISLAVSKMLSSKQSWTDLRKAGRQYVESERNWSNSVARYKNIYESLVGLAA